MSREVKGVAPRSSCISACISLTAQSTLEWRQPWSERPSCSAYSASPPLTPAAETRASPHWDREHNVLEGSTPFPPVLKAQSLHIYQQSRFKLDTKLAVNRASSGNNPASPLPLSPIAWERKELSIRNMICFTLMLKWPEQAHFC